MSTQIRSAALYPYPFSKVYWRDDTAVLKDTKMLAVSALMIALRIVFKPLPSKTSSRSSVADIWRTKAADSIDLFYRRKKSRPPGGGTKKEMTLDCPSNDASRVISLHSWYLTSLVNLSFYGFNKCSNPNLFHSIHIFV